MRRTTTAVLAAAVVALTGCSGGSDESAKPKTSTTTTVAATPSLSRAETKRLCTAAVAEAAPGWEDWNFSPGEWADDPRTPEECLPLKDDDDPAQGNRDFMGALIEGLDEADDPRAEH